MTFPSVVGATGYVQNSATTSWAVFSGVTVKRGSVILVSVGSTVGAPAATLSTASAGWQKVGQVDDTDGPYQGSSALFKATADNVAFTIASSTSRKLAAVLLRATGGGVVSATGQGDTDDPPAHSIGSAQDVLWVEAVASFENTIAGSPSSGYGGLTTAQGDGTTGSTSVSLAYRANRAASENPSGLFGINGTGAWTIALHTMRRKPRAGGTL